MFHDCPFLKFGFQVPVRQNFCCPEILWYSQCPQKEEPGEGFEPLFVR
jgi:hypothetical protein